MCDPVTLTIAATAVSALGSIQSGMAAKAQGQYQQKVANANAHAADEQARDAIDRGKIEQQQHWRRVAEVKGAQQAALAAGNVDTSFGSARSLAEDTAMIGNEDALALYKNNANEVRGFDINAANYRSEGQAAKMKGQAGFTQGLFAAGGTILSGASQYSQLKGPSNPKTGYSLGGSLVAIDPSSPQAKRGPWNNW